MEREYLVKNSSIAIKGGLNGIFGSTIYSILLSLLLSIILTASIVSKNPGVSEEALQALVNEKYDSFPYSLIVSIIANVITFLLFVVIIGKEQIKIILKNIFTSKALKYGLITALCIVSVSIIYNSAITAIFNLDGGGNANQEGVTSLISKSPILGFISVVLLAPIVEELTYRYCLFGGISKNKKWLAYLVSGLVFMAMHSISSFSEAGGFNKAFVQELIYLPPYLFSGLALCYAYDKSGYLGSGISAHLFNNLLSFMMVVLL